MTIPNWAADITRTDHLSASQYWPMRCEDHWLTLVSSADHWTALSLRPVRIRWRCVINITPLPEVKWMGSPTEEQWGVFLLLMSNERFPSSWGTMRGFPFLRYNEGIPSSWGTMGRSRFSYTTGDPQFASPPRELIWRVKSKGTWEVSSDCILVY